MPTRYQGSEDQKNTLNAFIKLMRASESVSIRLNRKLAEANLTVSQFGILEALYHLGPQNQKRLGEKILKSGGNITLVIDNLVKNNLVVRNQDPSDRRAMIIELTNEGKKYIKKIFPEHLERIMEEFSVLSEKEKKDLARICKKLGVRE